MWFRLAGESCFCCERTNVTVKMKRVRPKAGRLPLKYRCRDKYNRSLEAGMRKFIASDTVSEEESALDRQHGLDSSSRYTHDANTIGIPVVLLY